MPDEPTRDTIDRVLSAWACDHAGIALELARLDPSLGAEVVGVADGRLVLSGSGMYVNAAVACGRAAPLDAAEWATIIDRSRAVGVMPSIEISSTTHPDTRAAAAEHGFELDDRRDLFVRALHRGFDPMGTAASAGVDIVEVDDSSLLVWQETSARGLGHVDPGPRSISDRWVVAARRSGDRMFVAFDRADGQPVAVGVVHPTDGVGTLGGMSTLPVARGRSVQRAMLEHRLGLAAAEGCDLAASSASNPASARNLERVGFRRIATIEMWTRPG